MSGGLATVGGILVIRSGLAECSAGGPIQVERFLISVDRQTGCSQFAVLNSLFYEAPFKKMRSVCLLSGLVGFQFKALEARFPLLSTGLVYLGSKLTRVVEAGYATPPMIHFVAI